MSHYNADTALPGKHHVFVNLSNHPYEYWEETQKKAASEYGEASDLPFPSILPDASEEEINALADEYLERIVSMAPKDRITVHIMGEMTFTFAMVERLKSMGIRCVASTTERVVEEHEGLKTSVFSFVRFRDY